MSFWVYINRVRRRACWHREGCGYVKMHGGEAAVDQDWYECETMEAVERILEREAARFAPSQVRPCGRCQPDT